MKLLVLAVLFRSANAGQIAIGGDIFDGTPDRIIEKVEERVILVPSQEVRLVEVEEVEVTTPKVRIIRTRPSTHQTRRPAAHTTRGHHVYRHKPSRHSFSKDGWKIYTRHLYKVFNNAKSFDDAEKTCKKHGGHLASIHSDDENTFIHSITKTGHEIKSFENFVYIGLKYDTRTRKWSWTDGSKFNFSKWAVHQPDHLGDENCGQLHQDPGPTLIYVQDYKWNSIACNTPMKYFVCKK
ncbi:lectin C-type domain protein [Necator americanus]|uniref:Lectin C-type domain protein n=1 Tax=Necator americanus TaxID=51031 RepID=W2TE81_NECAM|nr:lectin C-type domain protein [Necator americanus]ETN79506.1 lectin C-type domain protein [Necator americanus]